MLTPPIPPSARPVPPSAARVGLPAELLKSEAPMPEPSEWCELCRAHVYEAEGAAALCDMRWCRFKARVGVKS